MKKEDVYLVRGEAIDQNCVAITHAYKWRSIIFIGGVGIDGAAESWSTDFFDTPSPALTAFIEEAKAYFRPKKSCGDLSHDDLHYLVSLAIISGASIKYHELSNTWATSRGIQLPSEGK